MREVLYGKAQYEPRFERYVAALTTYTGEAAHWELATAVSALVHPAEHVCVHPTVFRLQLKATSSPAIPAARPTSAGYARFLGTTRAIAKKLAEQGEEPRDLMDVHDFIRVTLKNAPKVRVAAAKPSTRSAPRTAKAADADPGAEEAYSDE